MSKKASKKTKKKVVVQSNRKYVRLLWVIVLLPVLGIGLMLTFAALSDLPSFESLENPKSNLATEIFTVDSKLLGKYYRGNENRTNVKYEEISPFVTKALISTEDERFMDHSGIDLEALARVVKGIVTGRSNQGGGSTVTQQLAKQLFSDKPRSKAERVFQKFQEWIISVKLERSYTKEEILGMYFNQYDFNNQAVGIKSAANIYFSKEPDELNIQESAMLVGMLKNSSLYNPRKREEMVNHRREVVLSQMKKHQHITNVEYDSLRMLPLGLEYKRQSHDEGQAQYFREILRSELRTLLKTKNDNDNFIYVNPNSGEPYDMYEDGLKVYTTIDSRLQRYAEFAVKAHLKNQLQDQFDSFTHKLKYPPFSNDLSKSEVESIVQSAVKKSKTYKIFTGKLCGNCERTKNLELVKKDGMEVFHCTHCNADNPKLDDSSIQKFFNSPKQMNIFTWDGVKDTVLTPIDSIKYYKGILQAGMLSMEPSTGAVKAWVGGIDFKHFKFDHVKQAKRQVGSTFKPIVYATAIREGYKPCHPVPKVKTTFEKGTYHLTKDWTPEDEGNDYGYMANLKWGLANSINTITAWVMKQFGPDPIVKLAKDMGITSDLPPVPSLCLGVADLSVLEITAANSTFANKGVYIEPYIIARIEDKNGNQIYDAMPNTKEAIDEKTAYIMLQMMKGTIDGAYNKHKGRSTGTAMRLRMDLESRAYDGIPRDLQIACKTGTTQNQSDGWFIGLIPDLATGIWVGADDRSVHFSSLRYGMGTNTALPIWGYYTKKILEDKSIILRRDFDKPSNLNLDDVFDCSEKGAPEDFNDEFDDL